MLSEALCCEVVDTLPDDVIEYCLVQNRPPYRGYASHRSALARACETLFPPDDEDAGWTYDVGMAEGKKIAPDELFAPVCREGRLNFRKAFLHPPHGSANTDADFEKLNDTLFPNGRAHLDVYAWTTDWSDYFDDGHEWWGALCFTVYDDRADRFVVILASATD